MSDSSFSEVTNEQTTEQATLDQLVGDDKKFKSAEDLARSKLEADNHIATLEAEAKKLREELENRKSTEDLLAEIKTSATPPPPAQSSTPAAETNAVSGEKDIAELVRATIQQEKANEGRQANMANVESTLQTMFGEHKQAKVREKAAELDVSVEFLQSVAATSPKAFYQSMGIDPSKPTPQAPPVTSGGQTTIIPPTNPTVAGHQKKSYFDAIRKEDKKKYFSQATQIALFESRQALGDTFYDN